MELISNESSIDIISRIFVTIFGNQEQGSISNSLNFFLFNRKSLSKHQFLILWVEEVWFSNSLPRIFRSLRRIVCSIAESRMKVWFFRTHAVIEKYSIILRIRNKLNASAFRSRTLNENRTVPPPLLPLAAPTLEQSSLTRYSLMPLSFLMTAGSFLWKFIEISNSIAVIKYDHHK